MNWKQLKTISAAGALSVAMLATSVAQNTPAGNSAQAPATTAADSTAPATGHMRGMEQLNLTDQQKSQIQAIRAKAREQAKAVRNDSSLNDQQKRVEIHHLRRVTRKQVSGVLTSEQRQQWHAQMKQRHQQMEQQKQQGQSQNNG